MRSSGFRENTSTLPNGFLAGITWDPREPVPNEFPISLALHPVLPGVIGQSGLAECRAQGADKSYNAARAHFVQTPLPSMTVQVQNRNVLPAASVSIEARITGDVAEVTARHVYWNDADVPIRQGSYTFPLPNACTVTAFTCRIGNDKIMKATARPKEEAQEAFQRAVDSNTTAALLNQHTGEIFTSSLGNIPPNTRVKTEITYSAILKRRFGDDTNTTSLVIPTYIANRYGQRPAGLQGLDIESKPDDMSLHIEIIESERIQSIKSTSHEILVERGPRVRQALKWDHIVHGSADTEQETAIVALKDTSRWLETDFILSIDTGSNSGDDGFKAWLEMHPTLENHAAMMITTPPRTLLSRNNTPRDGEIIFVVDRSGSMEGKMENLRSAMHFFLKGIPVGRLFNIWCFGSHYQPLWARSQEYGQESLQLALEFVDKDFHANMGGTELLPALEASIAARDSLLPCDIVVLTDGEVWRPDDIFSLVRRTTESSKGAVRFFSVGLGDHVSHELVEGIAKYGGGYSEVIPRADQEGWEERLVGILKAALTSHVEVRLDLGGLEAMSSPDNLGCLNLFQENRIFLLLKQGNIPEDEHIKIILNSGGTQNLIDVPIGRLGEPATLIHSLAARAILNDLEQATYGSTSYPTRPNAAPTTRETDLSRLGEDIACKYSLPSKWTSLFMSQDDAARGSITEIEIVRAEHSFLRHRGLRSYGVGPPGGLIQAGPPMLQVEPAYRADHAHTFTRSLEESTYNDRPRTLLAPPAISEDESLFLNVGRSMPNSAPSTRILIHTILDHQAFDGSIGRGALNSFPSTALNAFISLKGYLRAKANLRGEVLDLVAITTLMVAILECDHQGSKDLWAMMHQKAMAYIHQQIPQPDVVEMLLKLAQRSKVIASPPVAKKRRLVKAENQAMTEFDRVRVDRAPVD
ncbi:von Willebrand factor type A domain-containing protein [Xylaria palmicola]|nr:von Willebrand factor type A domain-containing protein [Xylaria palmicola]